MRRITRAARGAGLLVLLFTTPACLADPVTARAPCLRESGV